MTFSLVIIHIAFRDGKKIVNTISLYGSILSIFLTISLFFLPLDSINNIITLPSEITQTAMPQSSYATQTVMPQSKATPSINYGEAEQEESLSSKTDESTLLLLAQNAYTEEDYETAIEIYAGLISDNTTNPIPYNNMSYFSSMGIQVDFAEASVLNTHLPSSEYDIKKYYEKAFDYGSKVASGNILCLIARTPISEKDYLTYLIASDNLFDDRIEGIIKYIYTTTNSYIESGNYREDFFSKSSEEQILMLDQLFNETEFCFHMSTAYKIYKCASGWCSSSYPQTILVHSNNSDHVYINELGEGHYVKYFCGLEKFEYINIKSTINPET